MNEEKYMSGMRHNYATTRPCVIKIYIISDIRIYPSENLEKWNPCWFPEKHVSLVHIEN